MRCNISSRQEDLESDYIYQESESGQCSCKRMKNYYAKGVEGMIMTFMHSFATSQRIPKTHNHGTENTMHTIVHRHGDNFDELGQEIQDVTQWTERSCTLVHPFVCPTSPSLFLYHTQPQPHMERNTLNSPLVTLSPSPLHSSREVNIAIPASSSPARPCRSVWGNGCKWPA